MPLTLADIGIGTVAGDGTGDFPRDAGTKINSNNALIEAADAENIKRDGSVDMTSVFGTDVGTFRSDVADGATAVGFSFDTANAFTTAGGLLWRLRNAGVDKFAVDKDGNVVLAGAAASFQVYNNSGSDLLLKVVDGGGNSPVAIGIGASASFGPSVAIGQSAAAGNADVVIGGSAAATSSSGVALGYNAVTSKSRAVALAREARADHWFGFALAGEKFAASGDNQFLLWQPAATTTDATPANLFLNEDGASERMTLAAGKFYGFEAHIFGIQSDGSDGAYFVRRGMIARVGSATSLIGAVQTIGSDIESNASTDVAVTADDTNDALQIQVTGIAAETWRWSANVFVKDITQGA